MKKKKEKNNNGRRIIANNRLYHVLFQSRPFAAAATTKQSDPFQPLLAIRQHTRNPTL